MLYLVFDSGHEDLSADATAPPDDPDTVFGAEWTAQRSRRSHIDHIVTDTHSSVAKAR